MADPTPIPGSPRLLCFATQGTQSRDQERLSYLLDPFHPDVAPFDGEQKLRSAARLVATAVRRRPDAIVMEGTGIAGGAAVIALRALAGIPYVVSSGDAVGPFLRSVARWTAPVGHVYERLLCRWCRGFIGWSPYLVGRALTFGAPKAMTAANWAHRVVDHGARSAVRAALGIGDDTIVFGIAGSLRWNRRYRYCYGRELVRAAAEIQRPGIAVLIVGDGDGREILERDAGDRLGTTVFLTGGVPQDDVGSYLAAMDVASLPQSLDGVGSFRYTAKLSEYLAARLPVVTGQLPFAYDLDDGWLWRLPGSSPWDETYRRQLAGLMGTVTHAEVARRRELIPTAQPLFDAERQRRQVCAFIRELFDS